MYGVLGIVCVHAGGRMGITKSSHVFPHPYMPPYAAGNVEVSHSVCGVVGRDELGMWGSEQRGNGKWGRQGSADQRASGFWGWRGWRSSMMLAA